MSKSNNIKIIDCPRDAIQGIKDFISTEGKIEHINNLIASELFEYIDFGSFVSEKAIPQMRDTAEVLAGIQKINHTKLLAIVANEKGADLAKRHKEIDFVGYPFSISETFQKRNTNKSIEESYEVVKYILESISMNNQKLVVYISMAFGNPYGDLWNEELVLEWIDKIKQLGVTHFSIADTTGEANLKNISSIFKSLTKSFPELNLSIHLHSRSETALEKINAAYEAGCNRFEGAFLGYGGCPFAKDELVGNIATELLLNIFSKSNTDQIIGLQNSFQRLLNSFHV